MDLFEKVQRTKSLSGDVLIMGFEQYGDLFKRAIQFLKKEGPKITQHKFLPSGMIIWTVQGSNREYLVYPDIFCQCTSFQIGTIYREKRYKPCKHLLAQKLAFHLEKFNTEVHNDKEWKKFQKQFLKF